MKDSDIKTLRELRTRMTRDEFTGVLIRYLAKSLTDDRSERAMLVERMMAALDGVDLNAPKK